MARGWRAPTVRRVVDSLGVILGRVLPEELGVGEGDRVFAIRTPDGVGLGPHDPGFAEVIGPNRDGMRRHRDALRELARR